MRIGVKRALDSNEVSIDRPESVAKSVRMMLQGDRAGLTFFVRREAFAVRGVRVSRSFFFR